MGLVEKKKNIRTKITCHKNRIDVITKKTIILKVVNGYFYNFDDCVGVGWLD